MPEMLIGGEWRAASAHEEIEVVNPATEETVASVPAGSADDVDLAVATAKRAFADWSVTDVEQRASILAKAADLIHENAKALAQTLTSEQGKPVAEAIGEVNHLAHGVRFYAEAGHQGARRLPGAAVHDGQVLRPGDPAPDGRLRRDHAVQLPAHAARHEGRPRARERQHGGGQAGRHHAAGHARGRAAVRRGRRARRRAQRRHRPRLARSATRWSPTPTSAAWRSPARPRSGATSPALAGPDAQAALARARRLGPRDHLRGRRRRHRGQGGDHRPLLERRPGVPRLQARVRARLRLRRVRRAARRPRRPLRAGRRHREGREAEAADGADPHARRAATSCSSRSRTASPRAARS